jgi:hypothetical protein
VILRSKVSSDRPSSENCLVVAETPSNHCVQVRDYSNPVTSFDEQNQEQAHQRLADLGMNPDPKIGSAQTVADLHKTAHTVDEPRRREWSTGCR